jgi:hypothetical protein
MVQAHVHLPRHRPYIERNMAAPTSEATLVPFHEGVSFEEPLDQGPIGVVTLNELANIPHGVKKGGGCRSPR